LRLRKQQKLRTLEQTNVTSHFTLHRDHSKFDEDIFREDLFNKLNRNYENISKDGGTYSYNNFVDTFTTVHDEHSPLKQSSRSEAKFKAKQWLSKSMIKSIKHVPLSLIL